MYTYCGRLIIGAVKRRGGGGGLLNDGMTIISLREMDARRPRKQHTQGTERHTIQFSFWSLVFYSLNLQ